MNMYTEMWSLKSNKHVHRIVAFDSDLNMGELIKMK